MALHVLFWPVMIDGVMSSELGERIKRLREARRLRGLPWKQEEIAAALGVSTRTLGRWENEGTVPRSALGALEELYGVKLTGQPDETAARAERVREALERMGEDPVMKLDRVTADAMMRAYLGETGAPERTG